MRNCIVSLKCIVLICFLSVIVLPLNAAAQYGVPALDVIKPADNQQLTLSPDGRHIAFVNAATDLYCLDGKGQMKQQGDNDCSERLRQYRSKHTIVVYNLDKNTTVKVLPVPENFLVTWLEWATSKQMLATLERPKSYDRHRKKRIFGGEKTISIPLIGEDYVFLFSEQNRIAKQNSGYSKVLDLLRNDPDHVIMPASDGTRYHLWKVNIFSGIGDVVGRGTPETFEWFTDGNGKPSLRFDCEDGKYCPRVSVHARAPGTSGAEEAHWSQVMTLNVKPFENRYDYDFWPLGPAPKDGQFYAFSNGKDDISANIKLYDMVQKKFLKTVYQNPDYDVRGAIFDANTEEYLGAWYYKDRLTYDFADPIIKDHYDTIVAKFNTPHNIRILEYSENHKRAIVEVSAPNNPGEYYLYDLGTRNLSLLFAQFPELDQIFDSHTETLDVTSRDGKTIRAYLTRPNGSNMTDTPLLVMPHGGPEVRNTFGYSAIVQYFVSHGYSVLQVNHRGSYGYGTAFVRDGYGEWGGKMQTDIIDAVNMLYDDNLAAPETTCMVAYGGSGGYDDYVALMAGVQTPDMFACLVSAGTDNDLIETLNNAKQEYGANSAAYEYWVASIGNPKTEKETLKARSPLLQADKITTPTLITHPYGQAHKMYKALKRKNTATERLKDDDLTRSGAITKIEIFRLEGVKDFLDTHLEP